MQSGLFNLLLGGQAVTDKNTEYTHVNIVSKKKKQQQRDINTNKELLKVTKVAHKLHTQEETYSPFLYRFVSLPSNSRAVNAAKTVAVFSYRDHIIITPLFFPLPPIPFIIIYLFL